MVPLCRALKDADANARTQQGELKTVEPQLQKVDGTIEKLQQAVKEAEGYAHAVWPLSAPGWDADYCASLMLRSFLLSKASARVHL